MRALRILVALLAAGLLLGLGFGAQATVISFTLDQHFGSDPAAGSVSITFSDEAVGLDTDEVKITLDATGLASDEVVTEWYINYSADGTSFDAEGLSQVGSATGSGSDAFTGIAFSDAQDDAANGNGQFNIVIDFNTSPPTFDGGDMVMLVLSGVGLTADDFNFVSFPQGGEGTFFSAAKIQQTNCVTAGCEDDGDDNNGSDWLGAIPEPGAMALFSTGLLVAGGMIRRSGRI
jgi:hypothetical protein